MKKVASITLAHQNDKAIAVKPIVPQGRQAPLSDKHLLRLHQRLQTSQIVETLINRYFDWLSEHQGIGAIQYIHPDENIDISIHSAKHHKVHYVLRLEQHYLGEISLSSQKRFSAQDLLAHEQSIAALIHYLQNAINYSALEKIAFHDSLTGVMNRAALDDLLPKETKRAQRYQHDLSVLMIDIDHFKSINDNIGHTGGDSTLRLVAQAIKSQLRASDLSFRYGGDEFLLILPSTPLAGARKAAGQIMKALSSDTLASNLSVSPSLSIGVAAYRAGENHEELIHRADIALYKAKQSGRNCIC